MIDIYSLKARVWPALLAAFPAAAVVSVLFPGVEWWHAGLTGTSAAVGLTFLLSQIARSAGKWKQEALYQEWGGKPTIRHLRHRDSPIDRHTLARYHRNIEALSPDLKLPTAEQEAADPAAADLAYDAATRMLIARTRDTKRFGLLFNENIHYGFCRNLWGLKPIAVTMSLAACITCGVVGYVRIGARRPFPVAPLAVGALSLAWALLWWFWITRNWIRIAADAYAERLLEASDALVRNEAHT